MGSRQILSVFLTDECSVRDDKIPDGREMGYLPVFSSTYMRLLLLSHHLPKDQGLITFLN